MSNAQPIGIFDSGLGGLTVMKELVRTLPNEDFIYFGDTARLPYGSKSPETIVRYSLEIAGFLVDQGVKMIVVACNTASSHALEILQNTCRVPVVGVIAPGAICAAEMTVNNKIAVLGTKGTIRSQSYQKAIGSLLPQAELFPVECPLFVPLVEENYLSSPAAKLIVEEHLKPLINSGIDTLLLGCTHYPILRGLIAETLGKTVSIVDSGSSCAVSVAGQLRELDLLKNDTELGERRFYVSDDPEKFKFLGRSFLGHPIPDVELYDMNSGMLSGF